MNARPSLFALLALTLSACTVGSGLEPYYDGVAPTVSQLDVDRSAGNMGGEQVRIQGSGFGSDPAAVTVVFGNINARVLSASDSELLVEVPQGPLQGGAVDVRVGTAGGQAVLSGGFTYDIGDVYGDQSAYIVVNNYFMSCYGGVGFGSGCETFAWNGYTGIKGRGEFLEAHTFPRQHGQFVGYWGGPQVSMGEWTVSVPPYNSISLDVENAVRDLRDRRITGFTLRNPEWGDESWCAEVSSLATWVYGGGDPIDPNDPLAGVYPPASVGYEELQLSTQGPRSDGRCSNPDDRDVALGELRFCQTWNDEDAGLSGYQRAGTWVYQADWLAGETFFAAQGSGGDPEDTGSPVVYLDVPEAGINGVELTLPPYAFFQETSGTTPFSNDPKNWAIGSLNDCPDGNGNGASTLDEAAFRFEWTPADLSASVAGAVKAVDTQVRIAVQAFPLGWYGGEGLNMQASIVVPDAYNVDESTGRSVLEVPTSVLMQFPSLSAELGEQTSPLGGTTFLWGDPITGHYGYFLLTAERVTEYRIEAPDLAGDLVFSYVTGDFGFFDFQNPLDSADSCSDCQDNDGDGWSDAKDPDCGAGSSEDNATFGQSTCNDGLDNDEDGLIDAADTDCADGYDGETNCSDGVDNDGDGFTDGRDGECGPAGSGFELGDDDPSWQCQDGVDNDADGWTDFEDPDCSTGSDDERGFGATECNDGVDNDGNGDVDRDDLVCLFKGATYTAERPSQSGQCADGTDNDGDGYIDGADPDCEVQPYNVERYDRAQSGWNGWTRQCYNQSDDDGDGLIDALDPGCAVGGVPNGFQNDESVE